MMEQMRREAGNFGFDYRMLEHDETGRDAAGSRGRRSAARRGPRMTVTSTRWRCSMRCTGPLPDHGRNLSAELHGRRTPRPRPATSASTAGGETIGAPKIVLAAGLGNAALAPLFGLNAPVRPQRGQILVTERTSRAWPLPLGSIRQTPEGTIMLGSSEEEVGFDTGQNPAVMQDDRRARRLYVSVARANCRSCAPGRRCA